MQPSPFPTSGFHEYSPPMTVCSLHRDLHHHLLLHPSLQLLLIPSGWLSPMSPSNSRILPFQLHHLSENTIDMFNVIRPLLHYLPVQKACHRHLQTLMTNSVLVHDPPSNLSSSRNITHVLPLHSTTTIPSPLLSYNHSKTPPNLPFLYHLSHHLIYLKLFSTNQMMPPIQNRNLIQSGIAGNSPRSYLFVHPSLPPSHTKLQLDQIQYPFHLPRSLLL